MQKQSLDPFLTDLRFGSNGQHSIKCQEYLGFGGQTAVVDLPTAALQQLQQLTVTFDRDL